MSTLLLRFVAPLQSWGVQSQFTVRDSGLEPSKSGVLGLLAAALGRPRTEPVDDLAAVRMGVRVDREGKIMRDFHIAQDVYQASGGTKGSEVTVRYYLADAAFVVGLEGDFSFLELLDNAVHHPVWQLYLGRKAFAPTEPVWLCGGLKQNETLEEALVRYPYIGRQLEPRPERLRVVIEDPSGSEVRPDVPISFEKRRFSSRRVKSLFIPCPAEAQEV